MLTNVACKSFYISGKTAASVAYAEMVLIRAEDKLRNSVYRKTLEDLTACLEAASLSDNGDLSALFSNQFKLEQAHRNESESSSFSCHAEKTQTALRYIQSVRWASQFISPNQKVTPELLLDLHSRCVYAKGHHQSNVRFRRESNKRRSFDYVTGSTGGRQKPIMQQENAFPWVLDLCEFVNKGSQSPLAQTAIAYYQYAAIRPFDMVDDVTVRALSHAVLFRRGLLRKTIMPLSLLGSIQPQVVDVVRFLPRNDQGEIDEAAASQNLNAWISLYAASAELAANSVSSLCDIVNDLEDLWRRQLGKLSRGSLLEEILSILPTHPVLTVESMMQRTGRSFTTVNDALARLEDAGVLSVHPTPHQRTRIFKAHEALSAYDGFVGNMVPQFLLSAAFRSHVYQ